jgi:predicted ATPase
MNLPVPQHLLAAAERCRCHEQVFMVPPWQEIFRSDSERRHGFEEAVASYENLLRTYESYGYRPILVPKLDVEPRAAFVLDSLENGRR